MPPHVRVTQLEIARRLGVHRTTVSLALRKHPSIPPETRDRVAALAVEMGYVPDPMLSALASYRDSRRPTAFHGTLAWLVNSDNGSRYGWKSYADYHAGALSAARRYGYKIEVFDLGGADMTATRLVRLLQARSISGLLLCPQPRACMEMDFPWAKFSAVTFGYTLERPHLHTVAGTQYRNATMTVRELQRRGYQRIGFAFHHKHDTRTDHNFLGGYLAERQFMTARLEPLIFTEYPDFSESLRMWIKKERPDAIITGTGNSKMLAALDRLGLRVPEDIGVACPSLMSRKERFSGVFEEPFHTGEVAVDVLVAMMRRDERGIPEHPQRVHVEGTWTDGTTLRPAL